MGLWPPEYEQYDLEGLISSHWESKLILKLNFKIVYFILYMIVIILLFFSSFARNTITYYTVPKDFQHLLYYNHWA
jgi:hypothetical protein